MVDRFKIVLALIITLIFTAPMLAREFYSFPQVSDVEDRDIYLLRRPANGIQDNNTGTRNITGADLKAAVASPPPALSGLTDTFISSPQLQQVLLWSGSAWINGNQGHQYLSGRSTAGSHPATAISGLATVATSGSYPDLFNKPTIPAVCVDIFDGAPALSCAIDGGTLAFTYDATGANPLPAMLPYTVKLYEVGLTAAPVTPDTIKWSVPTSNSLLTMGPYSTLSTFSPNRFGTYSASKSNNWIKAVLTKGMKTCIAMLPVSATRIGTTGATGATGAQGPQGVQGEQGPPGESPTITKSSIQAVFTMDNPGGTSVVVRPNTSTGQTNATELITVGDTAGYKRTIISATGINTYHSNGVTKTFSLYSGVLTLW